MERWQQHNYLDELLKKDIKGASFIYYNPYPDYCREYNERRDAFYNGLRLIKFRYEAIIHKKLIVKPNINHTEYKLLKAEHYL